MEANCFYVRSKVYKFNNYLMVENEDNDLGRNEVSIEVQ